MNTLRQICSVPTAPFVEGRVIQFIEQFAARRPWLTLTRDRFSNLLLELPGEPKLPRLVFVAHMDHPGFVAGKMIGPKRVEAEFRGGVLREFVLGSRVRFFDSRGEAKGTVAAVKGAEDRKTHAGDCVVRLSRRIEPGSIGMFDVMPAHFKGGKFYSRACDDLAGAASALETLDQLRSQTVRNTIAVLLTRAEEDGFIGAIAAASEPKLLKKTDLIISIECSAMQPYAKQGDGVVIRAGDRTSIFNSQFTYFVTCQAEAIGKADRTFHYQRCLMPGGTCEATVFDTFGYTTAAACVPLGNYHNMDREKQKIGPEYVNMLDWNNMVKLFVRLSQSIHEFEPGHGELKERILKRFEPRRKLLSEKINHR